MKLQSFKSCWLFGLIILFLVSAGIRFSVLHQAEQQAGVGELPFTLESALHFRLHEMVYLHGQIPGHDHQIEYPHGIAPAKTYSVSSEFVYAPLAHLLPDSWSLTKKIRILQILWFSLGAPALALVIARFTGSRWAGWLGGLLYAVSLAAVIRSSGIEISRENFALPMMLFHLWFWIRSLDDGRRRSMIISALFLAGAMMSWDLIQVYLALWVISFGILPLLGRKHDADFQALARWGIHGVVLLLAGCLHPYLRSHSFPLSVGMLLLYGVLLIHVINRWKPAVLRRRGAFGLVFLPLMAGLMISAGYAQGYGHFGELLWAKIRFLNSKPADPGLLTYAQRIMWVPALHSADWSLTRILFPTTILVSLLGVALTRFLPTFNSNLCSVPLVVFYVVSLVLYVFFVRFQVFLIPFACIWMAAPIGFLRERAPFGAALFSVFLLGAVSLEAANTLQQSSGRTNVYYPELMELTEFLDENVAPRSVLGNFGVSGSALAYGRTPILLHPKFETEDIRRRVQEYAEVLFTQDELAFRDWADSEGADIYIHSKGSYASIHPEYQMRYFVDALEHASPDVAAWRFEKDPDHLRYFQPVFANKKYQVYRIVTREIEEKASALSLQAAELERDGRLDEAYEKAQESLALFPYSPLALKVADRTASQER